MSSKNQVTLPVDAMRAAGLGAGDEVTVRPLREGKVIDPGASSPPATID